MTDSSKFLRLRELADSLKAKIADLQSGNLNRTEIEKLTDESRELYERLVVIRFKAYSSEVKGEELADQEEIAEIAEPVQQEIPTVNFRLDEVKPEVPVQVSLIDVIEEVTQKEAPVQQVEPISFEEKENVATAHSPISDKPSSLSDYISVNAQKESLHDKLSKELNRPESLAHKLEHNPIPDLKRAISLNQRFQFSKELFKGNNQDYEVAIEKLNSSSRDEAMAHLDSLRNKYSWNSESVVAHDFVDLVERRHQ